MSSSWSLGVMLLVWPKGGAVALAAFREGYRQPMFWLLIVLSRRSLLVVSMVIPYFTFGDDFKMMKQLGFDMVMLAVGPVRRAGREHVDQRGDRGPHGRHAHEQAGERAGSSCSASSSASSWPAA